MALVFNWQQVNMEKMGTTLLSGVSIPAPIPLSGDNKAALHITSNPVFHKRIKHIEVNCHFVQDKFLSGEITTPFVNFEH